MEIHRPKASHSWREFFIEIGTITLGILIALGLESLIVSARDRHLVENARSELRGELQSNRQSLANLIESEKTPTALLSRMLDDTQRWLDTGSHDAQSRIVQDAKQLRAAVSILDTAAWEAAGVSQAVTHMPLREAQALTRVYSSTRAFNGLEEQVEQRWLEFSGVPSRLQGTDRPRVESGIEQLKVLLGYQMAITASAPQLVQECDEALRVLSAR